MTTTDNSYPNLDQPEPQSTADVTVAPAEETTKTSRFALTLTWELAAWVALFFSAVITRFWNLGARVMSHDESLHVYYSWILSTGGGFLHNPMMHGPFLFEVTAVFERIFGANDFTARLLPALIGIGIVVGIPPLLRPWLGRAGAFAAGLFLLVSPYVLFYSRYDRHDIQVIAWVLLAAVAILSYLRQREEKWLLLLAAALGLMLSTMEISFIYLALFASYLILRIVFNSDLRWQAIRQSAEWDLLVVLGTLGAFFSAPIILLVLNPIWSRIAGQPFVDLKVLDAFGVEWASGPAGPRLWALMAIFWAAAAAVGIWWGRVRWLKLAGIFLAITVTLFTSFFTNKNGIGTGFIGSLGYWLSQQSVARGSQPDYYYLIVFPLYEYLALIGGIAAMLVFAIRRRALSGPVRDYLLLVTWWAVGIFAGLSVAGEKMPWLSTHITVPFILLAAWLAGEILRAAVRKRNDRFELSLPVLLGLIPLAVLFALTARTSYMVNYVNYDYTTEFIDYAHGAPGVKWAMDAVQQADKILGQDGKMVVAYDSQVSWPMTWYLRGHPGYYGDQPSRGGLENAPIIIAGPETWSKVESYVGTNYTRYEVVRLWWPMEDYKDLTWERIRGALTDPQMRLALWKIIWSRDYSLYAQLTNEKLNPPASWTLEERMRVYIRKDLAAQLSGLALQAYQLPDLPPRVNAYAGKEISLSPSKVITAGDWKTPRNLAFGPDGSVYVLDSGNGRVVVLDKDGSIRTTWGSLTPNGQTPAAPGTFNDPWGIAVGSDGSVYVADTWNHRIQKFDASGNFVLQWGTGGLSSEGQDRFWGPRGVAVGPDGSIYVTDTGNRRVAVFDPQGKFQFEFEKGGDAQLDEPVGIAIGSGGAGQDDRVYIADTWNQRVAVFTLQGKYMTSWPVQGWESTSVDNKPYIVVDHQSRVLVTDPEGYRVLVFEPDGKPAAVFGRFGEEQDSFNLPTGIAIHSDGTVWVVDTGNARLAIYPQP